MEVPSIYWFSLQMVAVLWAGPGQSQDPRTPFMSPMCKEGTQLCGTSFTAFSGTVAGSCMGRGIAGYIDLGCLTLASGEHSFLIDFTYCSQQKQFSMNPPTRTSGKGGVFWSIFRADSIETFLWYLSGYLYKAVVFIGKHLCCQMCYLKYSFSVAMHNLQNESLPKKRERLKLPLSIGCWVCLWPRLLIGCEWKLMWWVRRVFLEDGDYAGDN